MTTSPTLTSNPLRAMRMHCGHCSHGMKMMTPTWPTLLGKAMGAVLRCKVSVSPTVRSSSSALKITRHIPLINEIDHLIFSIPTIQPASLHGRVSTIPCLLDTGTFVT